METILFDMGRVLLHLDYETAWAKLSGYCPPGEGACFENGFRIMFHDPVTARYERGETDLEEVFQRLVEVTGFSGERRLFEDIWCGIFSLNQPMIDVATRLAESRSLYLLSNSNELHEVYARQQFPEAFSFLSGTIFSHHIHRLKPDPAFFHIALETLGLAPEQCLFIDDLPQNVEAARACGIRSIHYLDPSRTITALRNILGEQAV